MNESGREPFNILLSRALGLEEIEEGLFDNLRKKKALAKTKAKGAKAEAGETGGVVHSKNCWENNWAEKP